MKLFTALLLREYDWELLPDQNLEMTVTPTPHPKDGLEVNFQALKAYNQLFVKSRPQGMTKHFQNSCVCRFR